MMVALIMTVSIIFVCYLSILLKACTNKKENQKSDSEESLINVYSVS